MDMNESERDNNHFEESMFEVFKGLEGMPVKGRDDKVYIIEKIKGISIGCEFILGGKIKWFIWAQKVNTQNI